MNITVNVDKIDLNEQIEAHYDHETDERVPGGIFADLVAHQLVTKFAKSDSYAGLTERVRTIRDEEIRKLLEPALAEAFQAPIHATNSYGEKTGASTTLRELIMIEARKLVSQPADRSWNEKTTVLQKAIREQVDAAFKAEIAEAVKEAKAAVVEQLGTTVAQLVTDAVRDAMKARA